MLVEILKKIWKKMKRRREKKKAEEFSVILPQEMLFEILLWLPVKSLARFKCISKSWLYLISDPSFARSHYDHALAPTHRILLSLDDLEIPSIDFNASSIHNYTTKLLKPSLPHQLSQYYYEEDRIYSPLVLGSCRGFMLIRFLDNLYVWNPCTGVQRIIPPPPILDSAFLYGFGYDSSTDDYLVTLCFRKKRGTEIRVVVEIFSIGTKTWKQFDGIIPEILKLKYCCTDSDVGGIFFNGANHWIAFGAEDQVDVIEDSVAVIVAFDLTERVFFEIALPNDFKATIYELHVIGEFLSLYPHLWFGDQKIWVMEEYKVQSSWSCLVHFSTDPLELDWLSPIYVTMEGDIVGLSEKLRELVKLNYEGKVLECRDFPYPHRGRCVAVMHTHSLLSLPCHNLQAEDI